MVGFFLSLWFCLIEECTFCIFAPSSLQKFLLPSIIVLSWEKNIKDISEVNQK